MDELDDLDTYKGDIEHDMGWTTPLISSAKPLCTKNQQ